MGKLQRLVTDDRQPATDHDPLFVTVVTGFSLYIHGLPCLLIPRAGPFSI